MRFGLLMIALSAACHSPTTNQNGDAPGATGDAGDDASLDDSGMPQIDAANPNLVSVHVTSRAGDGLPDPHAYVIFMDPTDAVVRHGTTDTLGNASWELPLGGAVTVLQVTVDSNGSHRDLLTTFRSVKPGDFLHAGPGKLSTIESGTPTRMTAHMPLDAYAGTLYFECGGSTSSSPPDGTTTLTFYPTCTTSTFDLLMLVNMEGTLEYMWQTGNTYADGGDLTIGDDLQLLAQTSTQITNIPANLTRVGATQYTLIDAWKLELDAQSVDTPPPGSQTLSLRYPPNAGTGTLLLVGEAVGIEVPRETAVVTKSSPANLQVDLAAQPLPTLGRATQTQTAVNWTETYGGSPDERQVLWVGQWQLPNGLTNTAAWVIIEPPTPATTSALIPLPANYADDDPTRFSSTSLGPRVTYLDYDNLAGYDDARPFGAPLANFEDAMLDVAHRAHRVMSPP